ncbi:tRNA pseudouridine(55) synthase TruB [Bariatricus massiliensis]|uniref:tRNA pseudouridine synthase B n=1 Tax=Bariatricus massiliensis TaxID=1745713 RepID=A0ABS8DD95_9FIRM|nr:tRNA pseudouridine(55) synthase TruB [Bariatricus massiliensis]MCB7303548.1 tRNA pseudouridine(55) synthase TruB [Bariatricus massiliensis]MCB7373680.1 tRNA pseudouridine(55) synthase TruB [Bariatricus massiliensis]MCB7386350.1 tRNA pseudouridine(55) synthase TruB [Bariatricus massiliensis]MCB7410512.1 tRNA pseudouridine(55) synthase TruB [Bariatricus massiliensis]MCQ5252204.1 tRNA pseudouridine(55) synthase TruB [Bariatricus massiliensis]
MLHGVLNIYKEKGYTSHDVVAKLRRIVGQKKIGHTGTLDPDAVGVLPVCLGKATKVCDMLTDKDKTYEAVLLLGKVTDTQDSSGRILAESDIQNLEEQEVQKAVCSFAGEYDQIPPMYSALKVNGKKLYELARNGQEVERKPRRVIIHKIRILKMELPRVHMEVTCSKGTYIRTLCHDIGQSLGCGGIMESLVRTRVERFAIEDSIRLEEAEELMQAGKLTERMIPVDQMFEGYVKLYLKTEAAKAVRNGNIFWPGDILWMGVEAEETFIRPYRDREKVRVYDEERNFIAVYEYREEKKCFQIVRMFFDGRE